MRLHPLSVPYRSAQVALPIAFTLLFAASAGGQPLLLPAAAVVVAAAVAHQLAYYRRFDYELTRDTFDIRSGVFSRRDREIPLRRIQNVDISQDVVQRVLGIAVVDFETAGGSETEASLRFVSFAEAKRLQREISRLKRAGGDENGDGEEQSTPGVEPADPEAETLFELTGRELGLMGLFSFDFRIPGLLLFLATGSVPLVESGLAVDAGFVGVGLAAVVVAVALFSWVVGAVVTMARYYGFRLSRTEDDLRYEHGLLQRYDGSIPFEKIQTVTVQDSPLKRLVGYATLTVETAGYAPGQGSAHGSQAAVPLAARDRVVALARSVEPFDEPEFVRPPARARTRYAVRYLLAIGALTAVAVAVERFAVAWLPWYAPLALAPLAPVAAHLKWKHRGYWLGESHVVTRNGFWRRRTQVVPYYRVQTVIDSRTVFQRRWRIATVTVDTAGSFSLLSGNAAAVDIDADAAAALRRTLTERLRETLAARRTRNSTVRS